MTERLTRRLHGRGRGDEAEEFPTVRQNQLLRPQGCPGGHEGGHDPGLEPRADDGIVADDHQSKPRRRVGEVALDGDVAAINVAG